MLQLAVSSRYTRPAALSLCLISFNAPLTTSALSGVLSGFGSPANLVIMRLLQLCGITAVLSAHHFFPLNIFCLLVALITGKFISTGREIIKLYKVALPERVLLLMKIFFNL